jgi:ABC-2 type transport system permease protein
VRRARILAVTRKELLQIRRDPRSLGLAFAIPMVLLLLFGSVLTLDVDNLATIVYDQDRTAPSRDFLARFTASRYFRIQALARTDADVARALDAGTAEVGVVIPRNFARDLERGRQVPIQVIVDGSNSNTATIALSYVQSIASQYSDEVVAARSGVPVEPPPVEGRLRVWYNPDMQSKNFIVPGLIAVIMSVVAGMLSSLTVAREWERGTMEQLIATPIQVPELIVGKLLPYVGIGLLDVGVATLVGTLVFSVPLRGSVTLLFGFSVLFLLGAVGMGVLISVRSRSQLMASRMAMLVTLLPTFMLSGFQAPIENMPWVLQVLSYAVPARYFVAALKGIFLKGVGVTILWTDGLFLAAFAGVVTLLAVRGCRKTLG